MKTINENNKVDDVYLSPWDRWLIMKQSNETLSNKKQQKKTSGEKT